MTFMPGLVSITFRQLSPEEIIGLVKQAEFSAIEWGGDVHVPHGDADAAQHVGAITHDAGLTVSAYGSYYRVGVPGSPKFKDVLASAVALHAPMIRIWTGNQSSANVPTDQRKNMVSEIQEIASIAQDKGIKIAFEYHASTLTDTDESALQLLREVNHENVCTFWQPHNGIDADTNLTGLKAVLNWIESVHIFHWDSGRASQHPLQEGENVWLPYLEKVAMTGRDHHLMLEFVVDDSPDQFIRDAATLKTWIEEFS